jgi:hypothetical protein
MTTGAVHTASTFLTLLHSYCCYTASCLVLANTVATAAAAAAAAAVVVTAGNYQ